MNNNINMNYKNYKENMEDKPVASITNFIPLQKIGQGSFSSVYKVRRINDGKIYALKKIKLISMKQKERQNALNEIRILASLNSDHIVQYRQAFFDLKLNLLCIVMELANQGDLQKKIQSMKNNYTRFNEAEIWKMAYHTVKGLGCLHANSIMHRDIKSANVFIHHGVYKLGDLNVSKINDSGDRLARTQTGTPFYASPEVWRDEPYCNKSDIWSLGCVIYEMCALNPPFKGKNLEELFKKVQRGIYQQISSLYSKQLNQFLKQCLKKNAKQRPSCQQLLKIIKKKLKYEKIQNKQLEYDFTDRNDEQNPNQLLKTIKLPMNLKDLKLPASNYQLDKTQPQFVKKSQHLDDHKKDTINQVDEEADKTKQKKFGKIFLPKKLSIKRSTANISSEIGRHRLHLSNKNNPEQMLTSKNPQSQKSRKNDMSQQTSSAVAVIKLQQLLCRKKQPKDDSRFRKLSMDHKRNYHQQKQYKVINSHVNKSMSTRDLNEKSRDNIKHNISLLKKLSASKIPKEQCRSQRSSNMDEEIKQLLKKVRGKPTTQRIKQSFEHNKLEQCSANKLITQIQESQTNKKHLKKINSLHRFQHNNKNINQSQLLKKQSEANKNITNIIGRGQMFEKILEEQQQQKERQRHGNSQDLMKIYRQQRHKLSQRLDSEDVYISEKQMRLKSQRNLHKINSCPYMVDTKMSKNRKMKIKQNDNSNLGKSSRKVNRLNL